MRRRNKIHPETQCPKNFGFDQNRQVDYLIQPKYNFFRNDFTFDIVEIKNPYISIIREKIPKIISQFNRTETYWIEIYQNKKFTDKIDVYEMNLIENCYTLQDLIQKLQLLSTECTFDYKWIYNKLNNLSEDCLQF